ncbi:MAG: M23 family metallopeptidase [Dehalobacterium sp.]
MFKENLIKFRRSRFYTVMLVPHSEETVRKFKVPISLVKAALIVLICCLLATSYCVVNYINMKKNMAELNILRTVNKSQEAKLQSLETETSTLKTKMAEVNGLENSIKEMLKDNKLSSRSESSSDRRQIISSPDQTSEKYVWKDLLATIIPKSPTAQADQWKNRFEEIEKQTDGLISEMNNSTEELGVLKEQLAEKISYLRAKPTGWPVQVPGRITSEFGERPSPFGGKKTEFHSGLDIAVPYGTPVLSTCDGKVVFAGRQTVLGKTVIIQNNYGFQIVFGHNSKINVKVGETVSRGDCVSHTGNTGRSTGTHLHYEVWVSGEKVDPMDYINEAVPNNQSYDIRR